MSRPTVTPRRKQDYLLRALYREQHELLLLLTTTKLDYVRLYFYAASRVNSGSIVSDYGRSGFDPRQGQKIFPLASVSRPALGLTQPPVQWVPGVLSPGVKRGDADHSPPSSAAVVNE
jgi:hypothetical protein